MHGSTAGREASHNAALARTATSPYTEMGPGEEVEPSAHRARAHSRKAKGPPTRTVSSQAAVPESPSQRGLGYRARRASNTLLQHSKSAAASIFGTLFPNVSPQRVGVVSSVPLRLRVGVGVGVGSHVGESDGLVR